MNSTLLSQLKPNSTNIIRRLRSISFFLLSLIFFGCSSTNAVSYVDQNSDKQVLMNIQSQYQQWKNTPYKYGGSSYKGIDCSAFVMNAFQSKFNVNLPRTTTQQAKLGHEVSKLKAGDLVFFKTGEGRSGLHVGIYYKNGQFLHVSSHHGVQLASLSNEYWKSNYWMSRRVL
ncbi:NlpC/P60 family protein [Utexia brackfieldae]|uniref:C40 family peptidase n=1 Tax=Utexia brackfieldae TaxID=3074108 RepID=UPI00370D4502